MKEPSLWDDLKAMKPIELLIGFAMTVLGLGLFYGLLFALALWGN